MTEDMLKAKIKYALVKFQRTRYSKLLLVANAETVWFIEPEFATEETNVITTVSAIAVKRGLAESEKDILFRLCKLYYEKRGLWK